MARVYAGNPSAADPDILTRLRQLPDDYRIFAEVNVGRNVDIIVTKAGHDGPAMLIAAELKRVSHPLFGQVDGTWSKVSDDGALVPIEPSNGADINYYWQAVHAANALQQWLWLNQRLFRLPNDTQAIGHFGVWPDLVLLGDPQMRHKLPIAPVNRFGQWWYGLESWIHHIETWRPKKGPYLCEAELDRLIAALNLYEMYEHRDQDATSDCDDEVMTTLRDLARRVERLERAS